MEDGFEHLLVAAESSDAHSTMLLDPRTGTCCWAYRGCELHGAVTGRVERLGRDSNFFVIATKDKPLLHVLSADSRKRLHIKSVLPKVAQHLAVTPDGAVLFAALGTQINTWINATGELISIVDAHYRVVTGLILSSDGSLLVSGAEDGTLCVFIVAELLSAETTLKRVASHCEWRPHSLAVTGISITRHPNPRILSCSKDHTAAFYSLTANQCLLKISCDVALTSCEIDPAECRIFFGTTKGSIAQLDLYASNKTELTVVIETESSENLPLFNGHSSEVVRLDVNHDGSLLASGDAGGGYIIWDILSRQCLVMSSLKGPICQLKFTYRWEIVRGNEKKKRTACIADLKGEINKSSDIVPLQFGTSSEIVSPLLEELYVAELDKIISDFTHEKGPSLSSVDGEQRCRMGAEVSGRSAHDNKSLNSETAEVLKVKVAALEKANQQIYEFAASMLINRS